MAYQNLKEVAAAVKQNGGLLTLTMGELRDARGFGRLGVNVRGIISDELKGSGIGHFPEELPDNQAGLVRLYKLGSRAARLIEAVTTPSTEADEHLRQILSGEAEDMVRKIRAIING